LSKLNLTVLDNSENCDNLKTSIMASVTYQKPSCR